MRKFLLYSSALAVLGLSGMAEAACIQTPTCSSLGYTSTSSCTGGVKCPFGNYWNCTVAELSNKITELETQITEMKDGCCSGSGSSSGKCQIGSFFYSDKTCSNNLDSGKVPIGIVVYIDSEGHGQAMSLKAVNSSFFYTSFWEYGLIDGVWYGNGDCYIDTSQDVSLSEMYKSTLDSAIQDFDSCGNTQKLLAAGMNGAENTNEFSTEGTTAGDWCMPAAGILNKIVENKSIIDNAMRMAGGVAVKTAISSTMTSSSGYWMYSSGKLKSQYDYSQTDTSSHLCPLYTTIRPVIQF